MISVWKHCFSFGAIHEMTSQPLLVSIKLYNNHCSFTRTRSIERGWLSSGEPGKRVSSPRWQISILGERDLTLTSGLDGIGGRRVSQLLGSDKIPTPVFNLVFVFELNFCISHRRWVSVEEVLAEIFLAGTCWPMRPRSGERPPGTSCCSGAPE